MTYVPPRRPEIKGSNERTNRTLQQELFADPKYQITGYRFNSYDELNEAIAQDLLRFNNKPRKGNQLSRFAAFEKVEKEHLKDLPLFDPIYKKLFTKTVGKDGYITFNSHHYQVGTSYAEKEVTVEDYLGEKLRLFDSKTLDLIGEHTISHDMVTSSKYHKLNSLKTEKEKIVSRDRDWFISAFASFEADDENIPKYIKYLFDKYHQATSLCIIGFTIGSVFVLFPGFAHGISGLICYPIFFVSLILSYKLANLENTVST